MSLGTNLRKLRELRNLTQSHMAGELNISQQNYCKMEKDAVDFPISRLYKAAQVLGVGVDKLFNLDLSPVFNTHQSDFKDNADLRTGLQQLFEQVSTLVQKVK